MFFEKERGKERENLRVGVLPSPHEFISIFIRGRRGEGRYFYVSDHLAKSLKMGSEKGKYLTIFVRYFRM